MMKSKNLYLFGGILALLVFAGFMGESGPKSMFGMSVNIWVFRIAWLLITISFFRNYYKMKKLE